MSVPIERHHRGSVTEHRLEHLHVGTGRDRKRRGGVPQIVDAQWRQAGGSNGRQRAKVMSHSVSVIPPMTPTAISAATARTTDVTTNWKYALL
jgi:hypothetical protein